MSPEKSGAQLYVPAHGAPLPFGKTLVVVEGEIKAGALHEAGVKAVGIGGFSSAMSNGQIIPGLAKALAKWPPETLYFLGDNRYGAQIWLLFRSNEAPQASPRDMPASTPAHPAYNGEGDR